MDGEGLPSLMHQHRKAKLVTLDGLKVMLTVRNQDQIMGHVFPCGCGYRLGILLKCLLWEGSVPLLHGCS